MPRTFLMSPDFQGRNRQWIKMYKGNRKGNTVTGISLLEQAGIHGVEPTIDNTWKLANAWWRDRLASLQQPSNQQVILQTVGGREKLQKHIEDGETAARVLSELPALDSPNGDMSFALANASKIGTIANVNKSTKTHLEKFLAICITNGEPHTFDQLQGFLRRCPFPATVDEINDDAVIALRTWLVEKPIKKPGKIVYWGMVKRFIQFLADTKTCPLPGMLYSRLLAKFKGPTYTKVPAYTAKQIRDCLAGLPERQRLYGALAINCGMNNTDIASLTKNMVVNGYLTRQREKLRNHPNPPTVSYKLWPETVELMEKFQSSHPTLWLVSKVGSQLVTSRIENGKTKHNDLITQQWKDHRPQKLQLRHFRNTGATLLATLDRDTSQHYLANTPDTVREANYVAPPQNIFDNCLAWLHDQIMQPVA